MPDTTYRVVLSLSTEGNLNAKVGELGEKMNRAEGHTRSLQRAIHMTGEVAARSFERVGELVEHVADKAIHIGESLALIGGGAIFAGAFYGVAHLNNELEQTTISLAAIFQAQGFVKDFGTGFTLAGDQLAKMKQDVKTLPGDLGQLSNIMKMVATPAAQGGLDPDEIRKLAGKTMLVSTILGVQQDMAAREMANLLAGRAGAHNILGGRLGLIGERAKEFNAESATKRVQEIETLLGKYQGATDRFAQSFIAKWTTLKDNIKYTFLADATAPLFDSVKRTIVSINTWFDNNQATVKSWASAFGQRLSTTWDGMMRGAEKFGPALDNLGHRFFELWDAAIEKAHELEPLLTKVAGFLEHVSVADITAGAKDLAELKLAGIGLQATGGAISAGLTGMRLIDAWQRVTGGAGAAATTAAEGAAVGEAAGSAGMLAGGAGAALIAGTLMDAGILIVGAVKSFRDATQVVHSDKEKTDIVVDAQHKANESMDHLGMTLDANTAQSLQLQGALENLFIKVDRLAPTEVPEIAHPYEQLDTIATQHVLATTALQKMAEKTEKKLPGGGGGTNIGKIELTVRGNDDPSRVARLVMSELQKVARNPTQSRHVPDWSK